jgi:hypothetical protein
VFSGHKAVDAFLFLLKKAWLGGDKRCLTIESIMISAAGKAATTVDILKDKNAVHQLFK